MIFSMASENDKILVCEKSVAEIEAEVATAVPTKRQKTNTMSPYVDWA